jgi:hypothetical protein
MRGKTMRSTTMLFVACCALPLVGCTSRPQFPCTGLGTAFWAGPESPYGDTTASYGVWGDGMAFVVWSDLPASNGHSLAGDKEVMYSGKHSSPDGRTIDFRCTTVDGKTGTIILAGQQFKLEDGSVFLVLAPKQFRQVKVDTLNAKATDEGWQALVRQDPEFTRFFKAAKAK